MTFGEKLSKLRREHGYTQEQLADVLDVTRQSISKWESNISYPETEKLVRIGKLFDCSMDYLLNEDASEKQTSQPTEKKSIWDLFVNLIPECKSEKTVFGMPLYHIGKNARGFFAIGLKARGIFSIGLLSRGIFSIGVLSLGVMSLGVLSLGLISLGAFTLGILALGAFALGLFAAGAISVGVISYGAISVGYFSTGALAVGKYVAVGDHAYGMIAIGTSIADGNIYSHIGWLNTANMSTVMELLDANVPTWLVWAKRIFQFFAG